MNGEGEACQLKYRKITAAFQIDIGKKRLKNDDALVFNDAVHFYAVSDGMGGLECGQKAARLTCAVMDDKIVPQVYKIYQKTHNITKAAKVLQKGLYSISKAMYEKENSNGITRFGATFCGVMIMEDHIVWINLGDSRGYQYSPSKGKIQKITTDHNLAQIEVEQGRMEEESAKQSYASSQLYRFVGMKPIPLMPDIFITKVYKNDVILICSDGLYGMMKEKDIYHMIKNTSSMKRLCNRFVKKANRNGGNDNISVIAVHFS